MSTTSGPAPKTARDAHQFGEFGNQVYLRLVEGFLSGGERNIRLAQTVLTQATIVQGQVRQAFEAATEQSRTIQDASRALATEFYDASERMLEASRGIAQTFTGVLYEAVQAGAEIGQAALSESREAGAEANTKANDAIARSHSAAEARKA